MVQVIERAEDANGQPMFVFSVYLSPNDKRTVFGYLVPYGIAGDRKVTWIKTDFGRPVENAFPIVHALRSDTGPRQSFSRSQAARLWQIAVRIQSASWQ
jgi:hypothetical protein